MSSFGYIYRAKKCSTLSINYRRSSEWIKTTWTPPQAASTLACEQRSFGLSRILAFSA